MKIGAALVLSIVLASVGFCVGWVGPAGLLIFPLAVPVVAATACPGFALSAGLLAAVTKDNLLGVPDRAELRLTAVLAGLPLGLLNIAPTLLIWNLWSGEEIRPTFMKLPIAFILGGLAGGLALGYGVCMETEENA